MSTLRYNLTKGNVAQILENKFSRYKPQFQKTLQGKKEGERERMHA